MKKYEIYSEVKKIREIYRKKWKKNKDKKIWEVCPSMMTHAHLRYEPVINICDSILEMFEENKKKL